MARYDAELKQKALAIAETAGPAEAARATGIPAGTIRSWLHRLQRGKKLQRSGLATQRDTQKMKVLQERAVERAIEEAGDYIAERLKGMADKLYDLGDKAIEKIDVAISDPGEVPKGKRPETHDRDGAAWLRALVGVLSQSIDKAQLLSGKPTARPEVTNRHEYDITQRIVTEQPELLDEIFAQVEQPGVADRCGKSPRPGMGQLR